MTYTIDSNKMKLCALCSIEYSVFKLTALMVSGYIAFKCSHSIEPIFVQNRIF